MDTYFDRAKAYIKEKHGTTLQENGISCKIHCLRAHASAGTTDIGGAIIKSVKDIGASLVVVSRFQKKKMEYLFIGSTSQHVLQHSPVPVLLFPGPHQ